MTIELFQPQTPAEWAAARALVEAYVDTLDVDLSFQEIAKELDHLASEYAPPAGAFLLARERDGHVGCVALRPFADASAEIKRLYVSPTVRGRGAGRRLVEGIIATARRRGYTRLLLDTLPSMAEAQALYRSMGFTPIAPYRFNPVPGTSFLELLL